MAQEMDVTEQELNDAERGYPVPGWYAAYIEDAYEDNTNAGQWNLKIVISEGKWCGHVMHQRFPDLNTLPDEQAKTVKKKILIWGPRLEVIPRGSSGRVSIDWRKAIDRHVAIKIETRRYEEPKGSKNWKEATDITFDGIYLRHDDRVPADIRTQPPAGAAPTLFSQPQAPQVPAGGVPSNGAAYAQQPAPPSMTSLPHAPAPAAKIDYGSL